MKVLIVTHIQRSDHVHYFHDAMQSIYSLRWGGRVDHLSISGGDSDHEQPVAWKYLEAQNIALDMGYDAMLCAESDMLLPPDALQKLTRLDTDIAYGLYCWRGGKHEWSAYTELGHKEGRSLTLDPDLARDCWGKVIEVKGVGQGCTLIHRRVLEKFAMRSSPIRGCDHCLALDAQQFSFRQHCDLSVVCGHINGQTVIWPDPASDTLYRIDPL